MEVEDQLRSLGREIKLRAFEKTLNTHAHVCMCALCTTLTLVHIQCSHILKPEHTHPLNLVITCAGGVAEQARVQSPAST